MVNPIYPTRSFVRFQAKRQLAADIIGQQVITVINRGAGSRLDMAQPDVGVPQHSTNDQVPPVAPTTIDEMLFQDICAIAFHPDRHPNLYQPCASPDEAAAIEQAIADEIVATYTQIKLNQSEPGIQQLNALL